MPNPKEKQNDYGDTHWYRWAGWRDLRSSIIRCARPEMEGLIQSLKNADVDVEKVTYRFLERVAGAIGERRKTNPSPKWGYAISLLGDAPILTSMIFKDKQFFGREIAEGGADEVAVIRIFGLYLERSRRRIMGGSTHRLEVWEMMDRVSRRIAAAEVRDGVKADRLSYEHIVSVKERCQQEYPNNHNVNVSLESFRGYFEEFCEEAHTMFDPQDPEFESLGASLMRDTNVTPALHICLAHLARNDPEGHTSFLLSVEYESTSGKEILDFARKIGVTRYEIERRIKAAATKLKDCIERSVSMILGA